MLEPVGERALGDGRGARDVAVLRQGLDRAQHLLVGFEVAGHPVMMPDSGCPALWRCCAARVAAHAQKNGGPKPAVVHLAESSLFLELRRQVEEDVAAKAVVGAYPGVVVAARVRA